MIFYDVTKVSGQKHHSGLTRVSRCLGTALYRAAPAGITDVFWNSRRAAFCNVEDRKPIETANGDWLFSPELFSDAERPEMLKWIDGAACRSAVLFYDAIPLKHPEICWPQSVARHPSYMKSLAAFDRVFAISRSSAAELKDYWHWSNIAHDDPIPIQLGADGHGNPRSTGDVGRAAKRAIVMVSIVEPRKNQEAVLDACETLWREGKNFTVQIFGRVNPHHGKETAKRMRTLSRRGLPITFKSDAGDEEITAALAGARALVMPSIAEGCGLPILESLWSGVPVLCSDLPPFLENVDGGGCHVVATGDVDALTAGLRTILDEDETVARLAVEAGSRKLPTWDETAAEVLAKL